MMMARRDTPRRGYRQQIRCLRDRHVRRVTGSMSAVGYPQTIEEDASGRLGKAETSTRRFAP